jgi:tRNA(Ser,Leu) C12 N-acetylase TAN1
MLDDLFAPLLPLDWDVVVTSREGGQRRLRRALGRLARLRRCDFRNVLVARVDNVEAFLEAVAQRLAERPLIAGWLGKILPIERTFPVDVTTFVAQVCAESTRFLDRLAGRSFHVRVERRGHKGVLNTHEIERAIGEHVYEALVARGTPASVSFRDPDAVLVVEVLGPMAGMGLVTRDLHARFPFVRID